MSTLKTPTGKTMTSIVWGLGIAALFYLACREGGLIVMKAPEDFDDNVYKFDQDCYKFNPYPVKCATATQEGFTPEIDTECGHYRHHGVPSYDLPSDDSMQPTAPALTGFDAPIQFDKVSDCKNCSNFAHPHCLWNEHIRPKNCGDARHYRSAGCYKFHPMDSIFRAPSSQIYLHQTRN